jgi:division protein CdvB (Snf7/Vps24/ESCRT-III family)
MSAVIENDLKELKDLITNGFARIDSELVEVKIALARIEATMLAQSPSIQKIPDLAEKVGETKNWRQIGVGVIGALIGAVVTYLIKNPRQ